MCSPDYNCYTESQNPKPDGALTNGRSAGFHIHVGYDNPNVETSVNLIKYLDVFVGVPSIVFDSDVRRRTLYGKAGSFRLCEYGCEYRPLSSAMYADDRLMHIVWNGIIQAIGAFNHRLPIPSAKTVRQAIDNSDVELAKKIISEYGIRIKEI